MTDQTHPHCDFADMLWKWFEDESRIGKEGMRPMYHEGLSSDDFKEMLDEHEVALLAEVEKWQSENARNAAHVIDLQAECDRYHQRLQGTDAPAQGATQGRRLLQLAAELEGCGVYPFPNDNSIKFVAGFPIQEKDQALIVAALRLAAKAPALTEGQRKTAEALDCEFETKLADYFDGRPGPSLTALVLDWMRERHLIPDDEPTSHPSTSRGSAA